MNTNEHNAKLCELLARKRSLSNFIAREVRQYPGLRARREHLEQARQLHGWGNLLAEIKAHTAKPRNVIVTGEYNRDGYTLFVNGREVYHAGNHKRSSTAWTADPACRVSLRTLRRFCIQQVQDQVRDESGINGGVTRVESEERGD